MSASPALTTSPPSLAVPQVVVSSELPERDGMARKRSLSFAASVPASNAPSAPASIARTSLSPAPSAPTANGTASATKQESDDEDEEDELRDDEPTPASRSPLPSTNITAPSPKVNGTSGGGTKSRKSSCDLCHHRKIKCDQVRPSCSSCQRKGHPCRYSEESEANHSSGGSTSRSVAVRSITVTATAGEKNAATPLSSRVGVFQAPAPTSSPAWNSSSSRPKATSSRPNSVGDGSADRNKRRLDRERIVNGYGSSSDEGEGDGEEGSVRSKVPPARIVETELADMLGESKDEVDELESGDEAKDSASSQTKKRDVSVDDELSGELLELASAPPKKKKIRPSQAEPPRPVAVRSRAPGRASLPNLGALPPTPASSTHSVGRYDAYSVPLVTLMNSLPSTETQSILFNTFFADPFLTEGVSLLQPQFVDDFHSLVDRRPSAKLREGDATTLANAFAFLAVALRVLPEETGKLLLASGSGPSAAPRSAGRIIANQPASAADPTPLDQRYFELALLAAQIAEQRDAPSVMYVVHKLVLFRYATLGFRKDKLVLAGGWLSQAIKTAQALGMSKEWEGIPQGERELRRRVMWSLYVADRQYAFDTAFPYTILDAHQGIHLPSPISEAELYKIAPDSPTLPPHSTEVGPTACTALFIHTHLARRITPILDSFATVSPAGTPHDLVLRFDASLDAFQDALPPYLRLFPLTDTRFDSQHPYLAPHRVRLHSTLLSYRLGVHRAHLATYLSPSSAPGVRAVIAQVCLASLRCQKSAKMLDPKLSPRLFNPATVFESASTLALIMHVERAVAGPLSSQAMTTSPEYLAMRAGVADGSELLDAVVGSSDSGAFARLSVRILREVIAKVDAGPRGSVAVSAVPPKVTTNGDTTGSPASSSPRSRSVTPSSHVAAIATWLDSWRVHGVNVDYLLREAEWASWEHVIAGM